LILALDLGASTGYFCDVCDGAWKLPGHQGARLYTLMQHIETVNNTCKISEIAYEKVRGHRGIQADHCYGAYQGLLSMWSYYHDVILVPVEVSKAKQELTGNSKAAKDLMIAAAEKRLGRKIMSHDHADAYAIWLCTKDSN
jgi:Holliday junction resolvasome RuvABC endonuclease subunit